MTDDRMDSEITDPSMNGATESNPDPTMSHETETSDSEPETSPKEETIHPTDDTEGTDPSYGPTGS